MLLLVGVVGVAAVFLGGRVTDTWGPRSARLVVIGGHSAALLALAVLPATDRSSIVVFAILVAAWPLSRGALNPPCRPACSPPPPRRP